MRFQPTALALLSAGLLLIAPAAGPAPAASNSKPAQPTPYSWFDPIIDVEQIVTQRFYTEPDLAALQQAAINSMVEALGDPYTEYVPPQELAEFNKQMRGQYIGIGASVRNEGGFVTIVSPLEDSPAYHAGLMAGDRIVAINGESMAGVPVEKAVQLLTGEAGATVAVTIERAGQRMDLSIVRKRINTRTVAGFQRKSGDGWDFMIDPKSKIGAIRLSQFTSTTVNEFEEALRQLQAQGLRGLVIDLRGNPGGLLAAAIQIADLFLDKGLIVTTKGRNHEDESVFAVSEGTLPDMPLALILNRESASASEVVSGALRDDGRAIVIGTRSFGKGSVQDVIPLPSGLGQIKITEQHYFGPSGKDLHRTDTSTDWGVDPTPGFFLPMSDKEYAEMVAVRRERDVIHTEQAGKPSAAADSAATFDPATIVEVLKDKQLAAAVDAVRAKLETGAWQPIGPTDQASSVEVEELRRMQLVRERILRELDRADKRIAAISSEAPKNKIERPTLLPANVDLKGGRVEFFDKDGKPVTTLNITGANLERWLVDAPVEKKE